MSIRIRVALLICVVGNVSAADESRTLGVKPLAPAESLQTMRTHASLQIELAAAEPLVSDPVAIDFGPDGRLWVAEMNDYGRGVYEEFPQNGRIRCLVDEDSDGRFDSAQTFLDRLRFPTDVKLWNDGVLICDAPDILFARDTNDDGRADEVEKLFTGFEVRNAQARVNSLRFGLDNHLYGAGGLFGGSITGSRSPQAVNVTSRDFRIDPNRWTIEPVTGRTQQGRCRDDWGNWFGCTNSTLALHFPIDDSYYRNSPHVAPPRTAVAVATGPGANQLIPAGELVQFELSGPTGRPTSACGLGIYRDVRLGAEFAGDAFVCEPVHQLVHRMHLEPNGITFRGLRPESEADSAFLSSTDRWFRPVQVRTGPDGALWVVDMYRFVIEHSRWIPASTLQQLDVFAGQSRGRIYRIRHKEHAESGWPDLTRMSVTQLVDRLNDSNGTIRDLAQQQLIWRQPAGTASEIRPRLATDLSPQGRIHSLWTLAGLRQLTIEDLMPALVDSHPQVVAHAMRLAEPFLNDAPAAVNRMIQLEIHADPSVRLQLAHSISFAATKEAAQLVVRMLKDNSADAYVRPALLAGINASSADGVLQAWFAHTPVDLDSALSRQLLPTIAAVGDRSTIDKLLNAIAKRMSSVDDKALLASPSAQLLQAVLAALNRRELQWVSEIDAPAGREFVRLLNIAIATAIDVAAAESERLQAIEALGQPTGPMTRALLLKAEQAAGLKPGHLMEGRSDILAGLLLPRETLVIQQAALNSLAANQNPSTGAALTDHWSTMSPQLRSSVMQSLLGSTRWTQDLIAALEQQQISTMDLDAAQRQRLLSHPDLEVRMRAKKILQAVSPSPRAEVVARFKSQMLAKPDMSRGRELFKKHCSSCHRLEQQGEVVGPDLAALTDRSQDAMLQAILDPNREIDARYLTWIAVLQNGQTLNGLLVEESATAITLMEAKGKRRTVLRQDIDVLLSTRQSLMPEGLEKDVSPADLSHLIAYVAAQASKPALATAADQAKKPAVPDDKLPRDTAAIVAFLLDESRPRDNRQRLIDLRPGKAPYMISGLAAGTEGNLELESQRIPWIWRVSIASGRRNDGGELRDVLDVCLPQTGQPLRHWQAVALGGGIVNGISQAGAWPGERLEQIFSRLPEFKKRWQWSLREAYRLMPDTSIKPGTRYDLLRMIALDDPQTARPVLQKYLPDADNQLQAGAIAGLSDIPQANVAEPLLKALPQLKGRNRAAAIDALLRTEERVEQLQAALKGGRIKLSDDERKRVLEP